MSPNELLESGQLLLAIDVGNSRIKFGLFNLATRIKTPVQDCLQSLTLLSEHGSTPERLVCWLRTVAGEHADFTLLKSVIAGTNPAGIQQLREEWPADWSQPHTIAKPEEIPIALDLLNADQVGIDRVLNSYAAKRIRNAGQPAIVVDSGTATTVDVINSDGVFLGGAILPGFEMSARALNNYTALLPLISIEELEHAIREPIGQETRAALQSGLYWGHVGAIRELLQQMFNQLQCSPEACCLIFTGGGGPVLKPQFPSASWEPHLTLQGTMLAYCELL